jgi:hypothetical protein
MAHYDCQFEMPTLFFIALQISWEWFAFKTKPSYNYCYLDYPNYVNHISKHMYVVLWVSAIMNQVPNPLARLWARDKKLWQKKEAYANARKAPKMIYNCNTCHGRKAWTRKVVCYHLNTWGRDPTLCNVKSTFVSSHLNINIYSHLVSKMSTWWIFWLEFINLECPIYSYKGWIKSIN